MKNPNFGLIYFIHQPSGNAVKIGKTHNLRTRLKSLRAMNPNPIKVIKTIEIRYPNCNYLHDTEQYLHYIFKEYRLNGEWFKDDMLIHPYFANEFLEKFGIVVDEEDYSLTEKCWKERSHQILNPPKIIPLVNKN
jgi:hypothetical protein